MLLVALILLTGCTQPTTWEQVQRRGVMRVGMDAAYPPFETVNENGEMVGFDVDLAREIAERLGVEAEFVNISYDGLYDSLLIGEVDILISALIAAPEFAGKADFSIPYFNIGEHLVVPPDSPITAPRDLDGRTLAVEYGSGSDVEARQWERQLDQLTILREETPTEAVDALRQGEADAAFVDGVTAQQADDLVVAQALNEVPLAAAVHPENDDLLDEVNAAMQAIIDDGTLDALLEKWF